MIELQYVEKRYRASEIALYVERLALPAGEIIGVLGDNGSGKTTLLKAIAGIGEITNGTVLIDGKPPVESYADLAYITEEGSYLPDMTPVQYGEFLADFYRKFDRAYYTRLLAFFQLEADKRIRTFSKGQRAKLELAAGFAKRASYIFMDEPFAGNDIFNREDFYKVLLGILEEEECLVISTHLIEEIKYFISRAVLLHKGSGIGDIKTLELEEKNLDLVDYLKQSYSYKANRVMETLIKNEKGVD